MSRNKQRIGVLDIGRIAKSEVPREVGTGEDGPTLDENLSQYRARFAREAQEKAEQPVKDALNQMNVVLRENAKNVAAFFSQSADALLSRSIPNTAIDMGIGDFPLADALLVEADRKELMYEFANALEARGIGFSQSGVVRFARYLRMLTDMRGFALTQELMDAALLRLTELNCWAEGDTTGELPKRQAQVQPKQPTQAELDDQRLDQVSTLSRSGEREIKAILDRQWSGQVQAMALDWIHNNLEKVWGVPSEHMLQPKMLKWVGQFFEVNNLNPLRPQSYDLARVAADKQGLLGPGTHLLASEKLSQAIENSSLDDFEVRRNINRRTREIQEATAPRLK